MTRGEKVAAALLAVFVVASAIGGACISAAVAFYSLAGASLVVAMLLSWYPTGG